MMKILFIHQNFPGQFVHLAPLLASLGHEVVAISARALPRPMPGVRVVVYHAKPLRAATTSRIDATTAPQMQAAHNGLDAKLARATAVGQAMETLKQQGFVPDRVFGHSGWGEVMFVKAVFPHCDLRVYAEYFYGADEGDMGFDPEFAPLTPLTRPLTTVKNLHLTQALVDCDQALSPTAFQKAQHPAVLQQKISVVHDGIDCQRFLPDPSAWVQLGRSGLRLKTGDEVVTFVARDLEPYRGYHIFMRALPAVLRARPHARVVIVGGEGASYGAQAPEGTTWKQRFLDEVKDQLDMQRVHFVGKVPHETLTQLMQISAVHVYLTYPFVLSWSLLEAMSIGCMIVASDTAPVREVITDGKNGLLTDFFDVEQLARRISDALENRAALQEMRTMARNTVMERFDLHKRCLPKVVNWLCVQSPALKHMPDLPPMSARYS